MPIKNGTISGVIPTAALVFSTTGITCIERCIVVFNLSRLVCEYYVAYGSVSTSSGRSSIVISTCTQLCLQPISSSRVAQCVARRAICSNAYGGWFAPRVRHCLRTTHRPSAALQLLGSLRISHNKFPRANK